MFNINKWIAILWLSLLVFLFSCRKDVSPYGEYKNQPEPETAFNEAIIVYFKDKNSGKYSISNPKEFLTEKAIQRRITQKISIDSTDLPVNNAYIQEVLKQTKGNSLNVSKWLNYAVIHLPEGFGDFEKIENLPFVASIKKLGTHIPYQEPVIPPLKNEGETISKATTKILDQLEVTEDNYGKTFQFLQQYQAKFLHEQRFFGKGKTIALLGEGYGYIDEKPEIAHLLLENKILHTYDFLFNKTDLSNTTTAGNNHLGMLAALNQTQFIGLAPKADFLLFRTDQNGSQEPFFETSWIAAMECADSLGVDIVSSSCVYGVKFNQPQFDIKPEQANGMSISSKVADIAFEKGILTVQMFPQKSSLITFVLPPADAKNIITVGNINKRNKPLWSVLDAVTADGRIKPELAVLAQEIPVIYGWSDSYNTADTPPILAGLLACLWEALPNKTAKELKSLLQSSASQGDNPDTKLGYGIPNFKKAYDTSK